jgi:hypothetical protein
LRGRKQTLGLRAAKVTASANCQAMLRPEIGAATLEFHKPETRRSQAPQIINLKQKNNFELK